MAARRKAVQSAENKAVTAEAVETESQDSEDKAGPVEAPALSQMGSTFAERAAAARKSK